MEEIHEGEQHKNSDAEGMAVENVVDTSCIDQSSEAGIAVRHVFHVVNGREQVGCKRVCRETPFGLCPSCKSGRISDAMRDAFELMFRTRYMKVSPQLSHFISSINLLSLPTFQIITTDPRPILHKHSTPKTQNTQ